MFEELVAIWNDSVSTVKYGFALAVFLMPERKGPLLIICFVSAVLCLMWAEIKGQYNPKFIVIQNPPEPIIRN